MPWNFPLSSGFDFIAPNIMAGQYHIGPPGQYSCPQCAERIGQPAARRAICQRGFLQILLSPRIHCNVNRHNQSRTWCVLTGSGKKKKNAGSSVACWLEKESKAFRSGIGGNDAFIVLEMQTFGLSSRTGHQRTMAKYRTIMCRLQGE